MKGLSVTTGQALLPIPLDGPPGLLLLADHLKPWLPLVGLGAK